MLTRRQKIATVFVSGSSKYVMPMHTPSRADTWTASSMTFFGGMIVISYPSIFYLDDDVGSACDSILSRFLPISMETSELLRRNFSILECIC